ncbi:MAG: hypothetical protein WAO57_02200, partial [Syntrophomonadaceae bacterium]
EYQYGLCGFHPDCQLHDKQSGIQFCDGKCSACGARIDCLIRDEDVPLAVEFEVAVPSPVMA